MAQTRRGVTMTTVVIVAALSVMAGALAASSPTKCPIKRPVWPESFETVYHFIVANSYTTNSKPITIPVHIWHDGKNKRTRVELYDGGFSAGIDLEASTIWRLVPRLRTQMCLLVEDFDNSDYGTLPSGQAMGIAGWGLPNLTDWTFAGTSKIGNVDAFIWQNSMSRGYGPYKIPSIQRLFVAQCSNRPLRLESTIYENLLVFDFTRWTVGPIADKIFNLPRKCEEVKKKNLTSLQDALCQVYRTTPECQQTFDKSYALFGGMLPPTKDMASYEEALDRLVKWAVKVEASEKLCDIIDDEVVCQTSSGQVRHKFELNKFSHMSERQISTYHKGLGKRLPGKMPVASTAKAAFVRRYTDEQLPAVVDYRGTGADSVGPKDQLRCGSCWTFSAVGGMAAQWFMATGQSLSLSEQQLLDCGWDHGVAGCYGGFPWEGIQYVADNGGIAEEDAYPYRGTFGYCKGKSPFNASSPTPVGVPLTTKFNGPVRIPNNSGAVKEALVRYGPLAVVIDASWMGGYAGGIYNSSTCYNTTEDGCDHAVVLVGYDIDFTTGTGYWIVKNSWGTNWGAQGYAYVADIGTGCGITTAATVAEVNEEAAAIARAAVLARRRSTLNRRWGTDATN